MTDTHALSSRSTSAAPKRVLIVDDSRVMRNWVRNVLSTDARLTIIGEACDAVQARDFLKAHKADVLTLDIEMPGMSGLEFLNRLMRARPMPVVMLSSLTTKGSDAAIQALSSGAIDCMPKPTTGFDLAMTRDICERVYHAACTEPQAVRQPVPDVPHSIEPVKKPAFGIGERCQRGSLILIGASTGGVTALESVLPSLDPAGAPVVIVQHMPGNFLTSFSNRLDRHLPQNVKLAEENVVLRRGDIVLAPGDGKHTHVVRRADGWYCRFAENTPPSLHCPSVDHLFSSAVTEAKSVTAVMLTGLGKDGAEGMLSLAQAGAATIGQDEETSVVYGMPRAAHAIGAVQRQLPLGQIGKAVREAVTSSASVRKASQAGSL